MSTSDTLGVAGIALSVVGIPLAFFLARRGRRRPVLRSAVDFEQIMGPENGFSYTNLLQSSSGEAVKRISRTYVAIWNHQGDTIRGSDTLPNDRLRVQFEADDRPLRSKIVSSSRKQIELGIEVDPKDPSAVLISFDFLDASDGGVIEIVHQGSTRPVVRGTVRGAEVEGRQIYRSLSSKALDVIAAPPLKRPIVRLRKEGVVALLPAVVLLGMAVSIVYLFFFSSLAALSNAAPRLINPGDYDLSVIAGQKGFAEAVSMYGQKLELPKIFGLVIAVPFLLILGILGYASTHSTIPRRIVAERRKLDVDDDDRERRIPEEDVIPSSDSGVSSS